jgi:hypothetical protein
MPRSLFRSKRVFNARRGRPQGRPLGCREYIPARKRHQPAERLSVVEAEDGLSLGQDRVEGIVEK